MLLETSLIVCGLLLFLYGAYRFAYAPYQVLKRCGIKGPTPVPFFGNYREETTMTKLKYYEYLHQEYGSVTGFYIGQAPHILITDLDMLKQILVKDFNKFMDHADGPEVILPNVFRGLFLMKGETWRTNRQILSPIFSISKVKTMMPLIMKHVNIVVEAFGEKALTGESFDITKIFGSFTMETILAVAFGHNSDEKVSESDNLMKAVKSLSQQIEEGRITSFATLIMLISYFPSWMIPILRFFFLLSGRSESFRHLNSIALHLVKGRRESLRKYRDMLQLMIDATGERDAEQDEDECEGVSNKCPAHRKTGNLTSEEVVGQAIGFLLAGYETTASTLSYTSYLLALNPDIQEKLQSEIDSYFDDKPQASLYEACQDITYLDNVIQESLRLYPPVPILTRLCLKTTVVQRFTIPEGASIVVPCFIIHKNPNNWKNPDDFDPNRFTAEEKIKRPQLCHLPFGFGPRNCIGMRFALLEAKMALIELLKRYTFVVAPDTEVPLQLAIGFTLGAKNGIYLKIANRHRS